MNAIKNKLLGIDYEYFPALNENYDPEKPIITFFVDGYYGLSYLKEAVHSVYSQDYPNIELILINNGALADVTDFLQFSHHHHINTPYIKFKKNQFSWADVNIALSTCWNAALLNAKGDYLYHLSYDDRLSPNFARLVVRLFQENTRCITAGGLPQLIDKFGNEIDSQHLRLGNRRDRYTQGIDIALDIIRGNPNSLFSAPGEILAIRKDVLLDLGGYDRLHDLSQVLKYAILGESGFDPGCQVFWRSHDQQLNRQAKFKWGSIFYRESVKAWTEANIYSLWLEKFGSELASEVTTFQMALIRRTVLSVVRENSGRANWGGLILALINVISQCPTYLPVAVFVAAWEYLAGVKQRLLKQQQY